MKGVCMDAEIERCEFIHAHEEIVNKVNSEMPDDEILYDLAELFKIFGDSTRNLKFCTFCLSPRCASATLRSSLI